MASPASSFRPSATATPEITITEEEVASDELHLPAPMSLPKNLTFHVPDSQKTPIIEEQPILVIPKGAVDCISDEGVCTIPRSAQTQPFTVRAHGVADTYTGDGELSSSVPIAPSPATLKQRPKILSELRRSISTSHLGHLFHHPKGNGGVGAPGEKVAIANHSGTHSPLPDSPDVQELFKKHNKKNCPDLDAVNKALSALRAQSRPGDYEYVTSLARLATSLEMSRADSKKALIQAMQARDAGRNEICRSLCLSIVQNSHADIDTRVYSYNILSTLASPGQAMNFLADAYQLVQENRDEHPECEKLLGVIALLKDGAIEKDGGCLNAKAVKANQQLCDLSMPPTMPREDGYTHTAKRSLEVPRDKLPSGALTPKMEKILSWASDSKPSKTKPKSLGADLAV